MHLVHQKSRAATLDRKKFCVSKREHGDFWRFLTVSEQKKTFFCSAQNMTHCRMRPAVDVCPARLDVFIF